ncbi:MAG: arginase family protein [Clostridiaceae bacterium]|nr:arginase family protein [Clostridiaceae bacterium]
MDKELVIMNFTGVYENEKFYDKKNPKWIQCKDILGTFGYCDNKAEEELKAKIEELSPKGIHFIDSGNFHYMSKLWIEKINYKFCLIVFDNHPDMQKPVFGELLSCGCWVKELLDDNKNLDKVILIGTDDKLLEELDNKYDERVKCYSKKYLSMPNAFDKFFHEVLEYPVYISIDKDVLDKHYAITDWDQGSLSLEKMKEIITFILKKKEVIGVDICGECPKNIFQAKDINDKTNEELLNIFDE